jgi:hypothetical protein
MTRDAGPWRTDYYLFVKNVISLIQRTIFIGEKRRLGVGNLKKCFRFFIVFDSVFPKKPNVPIALAVITFLGMALYGVAENFQSGVYAELPTERDPDIDVETIRLGKGSIPAGGIRILADLDPFFITDGHVEFNAPSNARNLKVIVAESTTKSVTHAVILNPTRILDARPGESLYHVDLDEEISGRNPWTGDSDKVDRYNNVYLMNIGKGERPISFNDQSQATITVVFAS